MPLSLSDLLEPMILVVVALLVPLLRSWARSAASQAALSALESAVRPAVAEVEQTWRRQFERKLTPGEASAAKHDAVDKVLAIHSATVDRASKALKLDPDQLAALLQQLVEAAVSKAKP